MGFASRMFMGPVWGPRDWTAITFIHKIQVTAFSTPRGVTGSLRARGQSKVAGGALPAGDRGANPAGAAELSFLLRLRAPRSLGERPRARLQLRPRPATLLPLLETV